MNKPTTVIRIGIAIGLLAPFIAGHALAQGNADAYEMLVINDDAFGEVVLQGAHAEAIDAIKDPTHRRSMNFAASNNLCVAYFKNGDIANAVGACDAAVKNSRWGSPRNQAIALSNRGVVHALSGDHESAFKDLRESARLYRSLVAVRHNLQRLTANAAAVVASR